MSWRKGFNFRSTSSFVTDDTGDTYAILSDTYPVTRNGVTFGFPSTTGLAGVDRNAAAASARLAGIVFGNAAAGFFRVDLPRPGVYLCRVALGDFGSAQQNMRITITDNDATTLLSLGPSTTNAAQEFFDASGVDRTDPTLWIRNNVTVALVQFATTTLFLHWGAATTNTTMAHLELSQTSDLENFRSVCVGDNMSTGERIGR